MKKNDSIYVAGHTGLIGSALFTRLKEKGYKNLITRTKEELDLRRGERVRDFFKKEKPEYVFLAAGKNGGILANTTYPADLIYESIAIESNVIHNAYAAGVKKLIYIGCSCLYPRECPQPMKEEYLLQGPFEPTNEMFSVAKLAGLKMCQAYRRQHKTNFTCCIAENLFGPHDTFDARWGHVIPNLMERFHVAKQRNSKQVIVWGTGKPVRSFMYIEDAAEALIFLMQHYNSPEAVNIGSNAKISIRKLSVLIKNIVGFEGKIVFDASKPDGMPRKTLDITRLSGLGWKPRYTIQQGLEITYHWYIRSKRCAW